MNKHLLIVGAQRSGTTYLYNMLDAHPSIYMAKPVRPEPKFFLAEENKEATYNDYFNRYFNEAGDVVWFGEKSTSYIESPEAAAQIKRVLPNATIMILMRNPVDRAFSNYNFTKDYGIEKNSFEEAIDAEPDRKNNWQSIVQTSVNPFAYIERGKYANYIEHWISQFGENQLKLIVSEQFIGNQSSVSSLYESLGVDPDFQPEGLLERVNSSSGSASDVGISDNVRTKLQNEFFESNRILETRYGLDLSCWGMKA